MEQSELSQHLGSEAVAMAEAALARGKEVPANVIVTLEAWQKCDASKGEAPADLLSDLARAHHVLAQLLAPATPRTILLLYQERDASLFFRFLGPIGLILHLMLAAIVSLLLFVVFVCWFTPAYDPNNPVSILNMGGIPMLSLLAQWLSAAGLGASFVCLYKANRFVTEGTFDPMYIGSYWIRFFLGLIAGLLLSSVVNESVIKGNTILVPGIDRVLLAILGGFSADLLYTFLTKFVDAFKSLFQNAADETVAAKVEQAKARLASQQVQDKMQLAASLMRVQQTIDAGTHPDEIKTKLNELMAQIIPPK